MIKDILEAAQVCPQKIETGRLWDSCQKKVDTALVQIKQAYAGIIKKLDKEEWDKVMKLNPDSVEYVDAYNEANTKNQCRTETLTKMGEING